ncbi:tape measure protein [Mixta calida]|uniref:tape measure protein n=1 Tax=Mixta calida TaxID=665913 RepID=UPI00403ABE3E
MAEKVGEIYYEVGADIAPLLQGAKQIDATLGDMGDSADRTSGRVKRLDSASQSAGKALVRAANDSSQAAKMMESLGNEIAILEEREKKGARAAVILAAELRAGSGATAAQRKEIAALTGQLYDMKQAQDQASAAQQNTSATSGTLKTGLTAIASAIAVSQVIEYGKQFLQVADAMTQLQARIDRLSPSAKEGAATFQALASIASASGSSLQETERLWETLTSSLKSAGATNGQILSLTDTLQKIGRIGGSSTEEMANALRQFGQSIASGTVRAEEFNSIIEQMPELARQMAAGLGISTGELRKRMLEGKLSAEDALNAIMSQTSKVNDEFSRLPRTVDQATNSLTISFQEFVKQINDATGASTGMVHIIDSISSAIDRLAGKVPTATQQIADLNSTADMFARRARTYSFLGLDGWAKQAEGINAVSNRAAALLGDLAAITKANNAAANAPPIKIASAGGDSKEVQKLEKSTKRKLELSKLEGESRARLQAQYDAEDAGIKDSNRIKALQDEYAATERNTSAKKASNAEGKKAASTQESINQKLEELRQKSEVSASSTAELSREQTILRAQQSLGNEATQEQIQLAGQYAAKAYDTAAALKTQAAAEKKKQQVQKDFTAIQNQASPATGLDNSYQKQLATIDQYKQLYPQKIAEAEAARAAIEQQYREQRINLMWQEWEQQSTATQVAGAAFEAFGSTASNALTGLISGTMSLGDAMRSIGNTVLNAIIDTFVQMGIQWAKSAILGATTQQTAIAATTAAQTAAVATQTAVSTTAAATTAAAWTPAAILSSIASMGTAAAIGLGAVAGVIGMNLLGKRKNGGPVSSGGLYQVGESGLPEIYQASNGRQYMIPGDNGSVISNKDMQGGGGMNVVVNFNDYSSGSHSYDYQANQNGNTLTIDAFVADISNGGQMSQAISTYHNAPRRARGG